MKPSPEKLAEAWKLYKTGMGIKTIARTIGVSRHYVDREINPQNFIKKMNRERELRASFYRGRHRRTGENWTPPPEVLAERNRAYEYPQNFLGDPPRGRSALDRRGQ